MTKETSLEHLTKVSDKIHELEHKLFTQKTMSRSLLKTLVGVEYDEELNKSIETTMKLESAIDFAKGEFAKLSKKHKRLFFIKKA